VAASKAGILDFLQLYPSRIVEAEEKVADAEKRVAEVDLTFLPIAKKKLREAQNTVKTLQVQHEEYHRLLGHFSELPDEDIQHAIDFLKTYPSQWAAAKRRELKAEKFLSEVKASSLSRADMVEDFYQRYVDALIDREEVEKKAFAMSEMLRYANHR